jgi:cytochrome c peroxidase
MDVTRTGFLAAAAALFACAFIVGSTVHSQTREEAFGVGLPDGFVRKYIAFRAGQLAGGDRQVLRVRLGHVKGLSRSFTAIAGEFTVNLESGAFRVSLNKLTPQQTYAVWLVDGADADNAQDIVARLATVAATGESAVVTGVLNPAALKLPTGFSLDRINVAQGTESAASPLATGSVNVFQKIFFRRLSLLNDGTDAVLFNETTPAPSLFNIIPDLAAATNAGTGSRTTAATRSVRLDRLISRGATLFFENTFGGNGRTCGTCHPASNNFTIDPAFIRTLPPNDPLFVAEFNPALAQLERPQLMRQFGLVLENLDGLDNPNGRFVMRGVPPTLALHMTLEKDTSLGEGPVQMTGWSGDGSPATGSLREFAIGAVTQHFTRRLARVAGRDFRLPNERQLDAMEAFQLSLGRSTDFDLTKITFLDANVQTGRMLFTNGTGSSSAGGTCGFCHVNGGALSTNGQNRNFNTNVEGVAHPARAVQDFPKDGGFGQTLNAQGTYGNGTFNVAAVVEAADTGPFFHNNVVNTLEEVVEFYAGPAFNGPAVPPSARFELTRTQVEQIADFMRALNVLNDIDIARRELTEIMAVRRDLPSEQDARLRTAYEETGDSLTVLKEGGVFPTAVTHLAAARNLVAQAQRSDAIQRRVLIPLAVARLVQAKNAIATTTP